MLELNVGTFLTDPKPAIGFKPAYDFPTIHVCKITHADKKSRAHRLPFSYGTIAVST
jgi:hypothetical protein